MTKNHNGPKLSLKTKMDKNISFSIVKDEESPMHRSKSRTEKFKNITKHIYIFTHGIMGSGDDFTPLIRKLTKKGKEKGQEFEVFVDRSNEGVNSKDGIEIMANRLVDSFREWFKNNLSYDLKQKYLLSMVGYSIGGLVAREAIKILFSTSSEDHSEDQIVDYLIPGGYYSICTPHLGIRHPGGKGVKQIGKRVFRHSSKLLTRAMYGKTGKQLLLKDKIHDKNYSEILNNNEIVTDNLEFIDTELNFEQLSDDSDTVSEDSIVVIERNETKKELKISDTKVKKAIYKPKKKLKIQLSKLYQMCDTSYIKSLDNFKKKTLISVTRNDHIVPYCSSSLLDENPYKHPGTSSPATCILADDSLIQSEDIRIKENKGWKKDNLRHSKFHSSMLYSLQEINWRRVDLEIKQPPGPFSSLNQNAHILPIGGWASGSTNEMEPAALQALEILVNILILDHFELL
mmetsp:Transcript_9204/g.13624  ORF Transcript_9204/g.13624 Transcript_9204/m.13624 type:complete len:458 (+) Transcript_9204:42-1415(+)